MVKVQDGLRNSDSIPSPEEKTGMESTFEIGHTLFIYDRDCLCHPAVQPVGRRCSAGTLHKNLKIESPVLRYWC